LRERFADELRDILEDEVIVSKPARGDAVIEEREEHREIAKRALTHVKLPSYGILLRHSASPKRRARRCARPDRT